MFLNQCAMEKNKSSKLTGFIAKLTTAANKGVKKNLDSQRFQTRNAKTDFIAPLHLGTRSFEAQMRSSKTI